MSFWKILATIGADVEKGIAAAAPIIGAFVPATGPILTEIETIIAELELAGHSPAPQTISAIAQSVAHIETIKQAIDTKAVQPTRSQQFP